MIWLYIACDNSFYKYDNFTKFWPAEKCMSPYEKYSQKDKKFGNNNGTHVFTSVSGFCKKNNY